MRRDGKMSGKEEPEMRVMARIGNLFRIRSMWYLFFLYLIVGYRFFL